MHSGPLQWEVSDGHRHFSIDGHFAGWWGYFYLSHAHGSGEQIIGALIILLHAVVLFCAAAIVSALNQSRRQMAKQMKSMQDAIVRNSKANIADAEQLRQISE